MCAMVSEITTNDICVPSCPDTFVDLQEYEHARWLAMWPHMCKTRLNRSTALIAGSSLLENWRSGRGERNEQILALRRYRERTGFGSGATERWWMPAVSER